MLNNIAAFKEFVYNDFCVKIKRIFRINRAKHLGQNKLIVVPEVIYTLDDCDEIDKDHDYFESKN